MAEEAPAREWTAEQLATFRTVTAKGYNYYQTAATDAQKAKGEEELAKF